MENLVFTQLSVPEFRRLFREEIEDFFKSRTEQTKTNNSDEIGGIYLAIEITGLAKPTIYSLCSERKIPHSKRGKKLYFSRKELTDWIANGKRKTQLEIQSEAENLDQNKSGVKTATNDDSRPK